MNRFPLRYVLLAVTALGLLVWGAAVTIPNSFTDGDVISASEMNANFTAVKNAVDTLEANQAGAAQSVDAGIQSVATTVGSYGSVDVNAPGAGYVLVITSAEVQFSHTNGTASNVNYGVSESATAYDSDQDQDVTIASTAPSGTYVFTTSAQKIFPVAGAGTHTFYVVADSATGTTASLLDITLSAVFIPTGAGTVAQAALGPASVDAEN